MRAKEKLRSQRGFTLAETLITLGIIGVVAAITIPNLITNYQRRAWTAQLQKRHLYEMNWEPLGML